MKFFFDRNTPVVLARMVDVFERDHTVRHHDDDARFSKTTSDIDWMTSLANDSDVWVVLSGDGRILRNKTERRVLDETGLVFFCLSKQWLHMNLRTEYAWKFIKVWPEIVSTATTSNRRVFQISGGASLKVEAMAD